MKSSKMTKPDNTLALDAYQRLLAQQEKPKKARKPARHEESLIQRACVAWFRAKYPEHALMLFAVPNGGGRSRIEASIMKGEGVTAGVSDLILLEARGGWGSLCIEMKTRSKKSRQRESQEAWQAAAERAGNLYMVVRTLAEFQEIVTWYMNLLLCNRMGPKEFNRLYQESPPWRDALSSKPEPGNKCRVKLLYDSYTATWDGYDWIDETGYRILGVISWMPLEMP